MNEEDIKNIEYSLLINNGFNGMGLVDIPTLKKLYEKYKELEEENKELLEVKISASANNRIMELEKENKTLKNVVSEIFNSEDVTDKYIPISLVEEKIEELDRKIKYEDNEKVIIWLHKQRKILQEFLENYMKYYNK